MRKSINKKKSEQSEAMRIQGIQLCMKKKIRRMLLAVVMGLTLCGTMTVHAQTQIDTNIYGVMNEAELLTVLSGINGVSVPGFNFSGNEHTIILQANVLVASNQTIAINTGEHLTIATGAYDFTGTGTLTLQGNGSTPMDTVFNIIGSTTAFRNGMKIHGSATLNYHGVYRSAGDDLIGETTNDDVIVNITRQDEAWDASGHDVTIGDFGTGEFNISTGSWYKPTKESGYPSYPGTGSPLDFVTSRTTHGTTYGTLYHPVDVIEPRRETAISAANPSGWSTGNFGRSDNLTIGNETGSEGTFNESGLGTVWTNTGNTVVGYDGTGAFHLTDRAIFNTGNFAVGSGSGTGTASISGNGTILNIYGTNDPAPVAGTGSDNSLTVNDRAHVYVHYNDRMELPPTNGYGEAHLVLGAGTSAIDNAYMNIDRGFIDDDGAGNEMTFKNHAYFEGSNWKDRVELDINPAKIHDGTTGLDAVIRNNDYHTGNGSQVTANMIFQKNAVFAPGWGSESLYEASPDFTAGYWTESNMVNLYHVVKPWHERAINYESGLSAFGTIDMNNTNNTGTVTIENSGVALFDFDVQGNSNHINYSDLVDTDLGVDTGTLGNYHKDYVNGNVNVQNGGHLHFRPMTGYYTDSIAIQFAEGGTVASDSWTLWPNRWFLNPSVTGGTLTMAINTTPFTGAAVGFNENQVGNALDWVYNDRRSTADVNDPYPHGANMNLSLLDQERDEWYPVLDWLWAQGESEFRQSMRQLSGEVRSASFYMPLRQPWRYGFERVNWRKRDNHVYLGPQNILAPKIAGRSLWVNPYYDYLHLGGDGNVSRASISRVSVMGGYDAVLTPTSAIGFVFGYSQPKLDQAGSRVVADDYLFGIHYNRRLFDTYEMKAWGSYGMQDYRLTRRLPITGEWQGDYGNSSIGHYNYMKYPNGRTMHGDYDGHSWAGSLQIARPYSFKNGVIRPLLGLDLSYVKQDETVEEGDLDAIKLQYEKSEWVQIFGRAGVRADFGWRWWNLSTTLSYSYLFTGDVSPTGTNRFAIEPDSPTFEVRGHDLSRTFVNVGLGTQVYLNRLQSRMLFLQYDGMYGRHTNAQNASLGYQMTF
jgi:T5SS/PEP-CTERM-associated repeat protein